MKRSRQRMAAFLCVCLVTHLVFPASAGGLELSVQKGRETQTATGSDWEDEEELVNDLPEEPEDMDSGLTEKEPGDTDSGLTEKEPEDMDSGLTEKEPEDTGNLVEKPSEEEPETVTNAGKPTAEPEEVVMDPEEIATGSNAALILDLPVQKAMAMAVKEAVNDLTQAEIEVLETCVYTGSQLAPEIRVTLDGTELAKGTDYTVLYGGAVEEAAIPSGINKSGYRNNNVPAGENAGILQIKAVDGASTGTQFCNFDIEKVTLTEDNINQYQSTLGMSIDFHPQVTNADMAKAVYGALLSNTNVPITRTNGTRAWDWKLANSANGENFYLETVGKVEYTAICKLGNYGENSDTNFHDPEVTIELDVSPRDLATLSGNDLSVTPVDSKGNTLPLYYTGEALEPDLLVTAKMGKAQRYTLVKDTDYTAVFSNNINAGQATVTLTGAGNYTGTATRKFQILAISPLELLKNDSRFTAHGNSDFDWSVPFGTSLSDIEGQLGTGWSLSAKNLATQPGYDFAENAITGGLNYAFNVSFDNTGNTNYASLTSSTIYVKLNGQRDISSAAAAFTSQSDVYPYTGKPIKPEVTVTDQLWGGTQTLPAGKTYDITYENNTAAGTGTVVITGKGVYKGTIRKNFTIKEVPNIANAEVTLSETEPAYDSGNQIEPTVTVTLDGKTLTLNTDYTLAYESNTDPGAAYVTITGTEDGDLGYYGSKKVGFFIMPPTLGAGYGTLLRDIPLPLGIGTDSRWSWVTPDAFAGSGSASPNEFQARFDDGITQRTVPVKVTVTAKDINHASVNFQISGGPFVYDPQNPAEPQTVLTDSSTGRTLVKDVDYTVSYTNHSQAGTGTVTVAGKGNYTGTRSQDFTIEKADCRLTVTGTDLAADGSIGLMARNPASALTVSRQGDGAITYASGNTATFTAASTTTGVELTPGKPGSATLTITVAETTNYKGASKEYSVKVSPIPISRTRQALPSGPWVYNGNPQTPSLTVTDPQLASGNPLVLGTDYQAVYSDNTDAGTAKITVTGIGDYEGTVSVAFTIEKAEYQETAPSPVDAVYGQKLKELSLPKAASHDLFWAWEQPEGEVGDVGQHQAEVSLAETRNYKKQTASVTVNVAPRPLELSMAELEYAEHEYTGQALTPQVTVTHNGRTVPASQYTVSYGDNTQRGTAVVTLTGQGNYTGTITKEFAIIQAQIQDAHVKVEAGTWTYDGTAHTPGETVTVYGNTLVKDTDYTVAYEDNLHAGNRAAVVITGQGNYAGIARAYFTIKKAVNPATPSDAVYEAVYGQKLGELVREDGWDWENRESPVGNAGNNRHPIFLAETRDYLKKIGESVVSVSRKPLEETMVTVNGEGQVYDGTEKRPPVRVEDSEARITDEDYTCTYENNLHAGEAWVIIQAKGNYTGEIKKTFTIRKAQPVLDIGAGLTIEKDLGTGSFSLEAVLSNGEALSYVSSSQEVATVDQQGTVTLVGAGTARLTVSYGGSQDYVPVQATVELTVTARRTGGGSGGSGGGSGSSSTFIYDSVPAGYSGNTQIIGNARVPVYVEKGTWEQHADGTWSLTDQSGQPVVNRWIAAYNPYADLAKGQSAFDWFRFDQEGRMLTGWYQDVDGETYYLNPGSDGTRGRMVTGWYLIDGIWYYFETKPDGKRGRLLRSTVTPDGYSLDENGAWIQ